MKLLKKLLPLAIGMALASTVNAGNDNDNDNRNNGVNHVLLISIDGFHQTDLDWCIANKACPTLAGLVSNGYEFNNAQTPFPSDSFPGMVGQATGGNPKTTGIYYDDEYSRALLPQGTTNCTGVPLGVEVYYTEQNEPTINGNISLDAGQNIDGLYPIVNTLVAGDVTSVPGSIMKLATSPNDVRNIEVDPTTLPVDPTTCTPVYSHEYLQVNTIFEVAKAHGLRTAWSDKHAAYEILNGPSGFGVDELFAPEINSVVDLSLTSADWTTDNTYTQKYDTIKVAAVLNQIKGKDHSGINNTPVPGIFGMNFQAYSTAQKLNTSSTPSNAAMQLGGYNADGSPGPVLLSALAFVDNSLKQLQAAINANSSIQNQTAIIVSAKHGQSPLQRSQVKMFNDGNNTTVAAGGGLTDAANAAWLAAYPNKVQPLIAHPMDDDGILWWLNDRVDGPAFAKQFLLSYNSGATINGLVVPDAVSSDVNGNSVNVPFTTAGVVPTQIYVGADAANYFGVNVNDTRYPDVIAIAQVGSIYAGGKLSKIAEHGGGNVSDRHVPIIVSAPSIKSGKVFTNSVETTQIAPTILNLLNIDPYELQAVRAENTQVLPGLR